MNDPTSSRETIILSDGKEVVMSPMSHRDRMTVVKMLFRYYRRELIEAIPPDLKKDEYNRMYSLAMRDANERDIEEVYSLFTRNLDAMAEMMNIVLSASHVTVAEARLLLEDGDNYNQLVSAFIRLNSSSKTEDDNEDNDSVVEEDQAQKKRETH